MELALIVAVIVVALGFDYTNGFHDAANAIATSVSTRALTPRAALVMAAVMNLVGAFLGTGVAQTVGSGIVELPETESSLVVILAALLGAIVWNLTTWWFGLPSSSSHALIGGLVGATLAAAGTVKWAGILDKVVIPMIVSPVVGFTLAFLLMTAIMWIFRRTHPGRVNRGFRIAQTFSAAAMALGHGLQDAQKTMGVITLALVVGGVQADVLRAVVGDRPVRDCSCRGDLCRRLADHADPRPTHRPPRPAARIRRGDNCVECAVHDRVRLRRPDLDDTDDHLSGHGGGRDPSALRRSLGCCRRHRVGVGADHPDGGVGGGHMLSGSCML